MPTSQERQFPTSDRRESNVEKKIPEFIGPSFDFNEMNYGTKLDADSNETFADAFYEHDQEMSTLNQKRATTAKEVAKRKTDVVSNEKASYPQELTKENNKTSWNINPRTASVMIKHQKKRDVAQTEEGQTTPKSIPTKTPIFKGSKAHRGTVGQSSVSVPP